MKAIRLMIMSMALMATTAMAQVQGQIDSWDPSTGGLGGLGGLGSTRGRVSVEVGMNGMEYSGNHQIHLRQLLKDRNPWLQIRDFRLESVTIFAKSRYGQGSMQLVINGQTVHQANVPGDEYNYYRNESRTYTPIRLNNYAYVQDSTWVLRTSGNVRILKVQFNLVEDRGGGRPGPVAPQVVKVASGKLDKLIEDRKSHSVRVNDVQEIRVVSLSRNFLLKELVISFANGDVQHYYPGAEVSRGRDLRIRLQNRDIRHLEIVGTSLDLIGSRAEYVIQAVVAGRGY